MNETKYIYTTHSGNEVELSKAMHERIQNGEKLKHRGGKGLLDWNCAWHTNRCIKAAATEETDVSENNEAVETPRVSKRRTSLDTRNGAPTKSEQVRAAIRDNADKGVDFVVQWAVDTLGMAKALATTYVKGNWDKALAAAAPEAAAA